MTPQEFASRHLGMFKQKGDEIVPDFCPYCKGGQHKDKYTFALNVHTGAWNCRRGSCNKSGSLNQLLQDFGEEPSYKKTFEVTSHHRKFLEPQSKITAAEKKVYDYLTRRGFSKATWEKMGVGEVDGNIAFPYYENGKLVLVKFRKPEKHEGGRKAWREEGGKAVFWGMDLCNHELPLVIVEGEYDQLALMEAGVSNVTSVPSGAEDLSCMDNCWEWITKFKQVIIWPDNDEPGQEMCRKLISKLGAWRCMVVKSKYKDANEHLFREGKDSVKRAVYSAEYVPIAGLIRLADVKAYDPAKEIRVLSSVPKLNETIGGYAMGQLSVWTGITGSGKSTFLGQEMLAAVSQKIPVMAYSGELPGAVFRYILELQIAGPDGVVSDTDMAGRQTYKVKPDLWRDVRDWYAPYFYLLDSFGGVSAEALLEVFEYAARRHDCKVFLVDNLMTTRFEGNKDDFYRKQSELIGRLKDFAHEFNVHVHIVAHPRKVEGKITKFDISGSLDIANRPDNIFSVHRVGEKEKEDMDNWTNLVSILKDRSGGLQDTQIGLLFETRCRRFYRETAGFRLR